MATEAPISSSLSGSAATSDDLGIYIVVIVQFIIGIFGIILNSFVLYVTIKYKQFRKLSNYLLGFICFYDAIYGTGGIVPFVTMTGKWRIRLIYCFFLESPSSPFSVLNSVDLILLLGLERLVSVLWPIWYKSRANGLKKWAFPLFVLCSLKNSYIFYFYFQYVLTTPDLLVYCQPSDYTQGYAFTVATDLGLVSNISTLVTYFLLWTTIKIRKIGSGNPETGHQINKSILVLVLIYSGFWLIYIIIGSIVLPSLAFDNAVTKLFYLRLLVQLNRLATVLNAPVLYFCSSEYRSAFRKEMHRFIGGQHQLTLPPNTIGLVQNRIVPQQQQQQCQEGQRRQQQPMINNMIMSSSD